MFKNEAQVVVPLSVIEAALEQLDYWQDVAYDEDNTIQAVRGDLEAAKSQKEHMVVCKPVETDKTKKLPHDVTVPHGRK